MRTRVTVVVRGRVQGVAFRHHTARTAARLGVCGWVANQADGSVKGCFEGEDEAVRAMVEWCRRGPDLAQVEQLTEEPGEYTGEFAGFSIRY
ncbi:acylphosphatase [Geomonas sp. Red276]